MVKYYEESLDRVFFALADNKRRHILRELCQGYRTAKELAEPFKISLPAVTKHLKVLESAGLLKREVRGRNHYFYLHQESFQSATEWINYFENFWEGSLEKLDHFLQSQDQ